MKEQKETYKQVNSYLDKKHKQQNGIRVRVIRELSWRKLRNQKREEDNTQLFTKHLSTYPKKPIAMDCSLSQQTQTGETSSNAAQQLSLAI